MSALSANANLVLHAGALGVALTFIAVEALQANANTEQLIFSGFDREFALYGLANGLGILVVALGAVHFVVWRSAKHAGAAYDAFVATHFGYLRGLSLVSDVFAKFCALAGLIIAQRPEWIAPMLFVFLADWLVQGRFFVLPVQLAYGGALACLAAATWHVTRGSPLLVYPFVGFAALCAASLARLWLARRAGATPAVVGAAHG
jgi:hypothetical protein